MNSVRHSTDQSMMKSRTSRWLCLLTFALLPLCGCQQAGGVATNARGSAGSSGSGGATGESLSLLESQLLQIIERQQELDADAAQPDPEIGDIQRRFHQISNEYAALLARNPNSLEARLLYGKFLFAYGDEDGALDQFLTAARIDPNVAVIHQQIGTYFALQEDYTRALAYFLNAVQLEPQTAAYHFGLGQLLAAFRNEFIVEEVFTVAQLDAQMLHAFRTASRLEPNNIPYQFRYGEAYYDVMMPDWQAALSHWQTLGSYPLSGVLTDAVRLHMARVLLELGRTEEAQALVDQVTHPSLLHSREQLRN